MKTNRFIKYLTAAAGLWLMTAGMQSCKDDEIHEIISGVDYTVTLQSGAIVNASDVIKDKDLNDRFYSDNEEVADYDWDNSEIYALYPGATVIHNLNDCLVGVKVLPYTGPALFPELPDFTTHWNETTVKDYMQKNGYTLESETMETVDNRKCIALKYAPFGNSESITFYVIDSSWSYLYYARIVTGKSVADNRGFLLQDYELDMNSGKIGNRNFVKKDNGSYSGTYITSADGWKTLQARY